MLTPTVERSARHGSAGAATASTRRGRRLGRGDLDAAEQLRDGDADRGRDARADAQAGDLGAGLVVGDVGLVDRRLAPGAEALLRETDGLADLPDAFADRHGAQISTAQCRVKHHKTRNPSSTSGIGSRVAGIWSPILPRIKQLREERGVSHEACATALGLASRGQYSRRETGATDFTWAEIERLRAFLGAPEPWPFVTLAEAYELEASRRLRASGMVVREAAHSGRLYQWRARQGDVPELVVAEMNRRANLDVGAWDDSDIALIRVIAERHSTSTSPPHKSDQQGPQGPRRASPTAQPGKPRRAGARK
jgi:transcriptional regulator with XRE-family HTH domain